MLTTNKLFSVAFSHPEVDREHLDFILIGSQPTLSLTKVNFKALYFYQRKGGMGGKGQDYSLLGL